MTPAAIHAEIGRYYRVPCIFVPTGFCSAEPTWVPVIGPKHADPELGADRDHWHVDWRFAPARMLRAATGVVSGSPHGKVISFDGEHHEHVDADGHWVQKLTRPPVLRRMLCKRLMPDFPVRPRPAWAAMELAQRARCDRLKDGHICPHRGIDLRPFARPDGTAVCPGHGLHWDLKTGAMLPRHANTGGTT